MFFETSELREHFHKCFKFFGLAMCSMNKYEDFVTSIYLNPGLIIDGKLESVGTNIDEIKIPLHKGLSIVNADVHKLVAQKQKSKEITSMLKALRGHEETRMFNDMAYESERLKSAPDVTAFNIAYLKSDAVRNGVSDDTNVVMVRSDKVTQFPRIHEWSIMPAVMLSRIGSKVSDLSGGAISPSMAKISIVVIIFLIIAFIVYYYKYGEKKKAFKNRRRFEYKRPIILSR